MPSGLTMTEHDYETGVGLIALAEKAMTEGKNDVAHVCLIEAMKLLQIPQEV